MNIEIAQELINTRLKNNLGRYNSRSLNEKWFIKNDLKELYQFILEHTDIIKDRPIGERLWAIENYPIPYCECGKPAKRYDNARYWSKYCSKECSLSSPIRAQQISQTKLSIDHTISNNKRSNTMIEKYGVAYNSQRPELKDMLSEKLSKVNLSEDVRTKLLDAEWIKEEYVVKGRSALEISKEIDCVYSTVLVYIRKLGIPIRKIYNTSIPQKEIESYIQNTLNVDCYSSVGLLGGKKEIDVYLPDYNLGIELNGLWFHSYNNFETKDQINRHLSKTILAEENNIELLQFTDYQWNTKQDIIKSILSNKIGISERIFARQCEIRMVNNIDEKLFLTDNHFQGYISSSVKIGLYYNNELVSLMTFIKSRYNKKYDWELLRFANKKFVTVVGGFSKLLTHFRKHYSGTIISYADRQRSTGKVYLLNGFTLLNKTDPGYYWTDGNIVISRYKSMKNKLSSWLTNFDPIKSEAENMFANKYKRFWDCGQLVFVLN